MEQSSRVSPLLRLPLEIRRQIYAHLLSPRPSPTAFQLTFPRPILLTNRQIHHEASEVLYSLNTFTLEIEPISPPLQNSFAHLSASRYFPLVRQYALNISIPNPPWSGNSVAETFDPSGDHSGERRRLHRCLLNLCELLATAPRLKRVDLHVTEDWYNEDLEFRLVALEPLRLLAKRVERVGIVWTRTGSRFRFDHSPEKEREMAGEMQALIETWQVEMKALLEGR